MPKLINKNYIDKTHVWLHTKSKNSRNIELQMYYEDSGNIYYVDNKKVVMDYSKKELEIANWLKDTFNEKVILLPKVNYPEHVQTPDYIFKGEKWDLKEIKNATSKLRAVDNVIKKSKNQSENFILDITSSNLDDSLIIKQVINTFSHGKCYRHWVKRIIIKRNDNLIGFFEKR